MAYETLDKLIEIYSDSALQDIPDDALHAKARAVNQLREDIINEIVIEKRKEYEQEMLKEMEIKIQKKKISQLKVFMTEGIILAFFVGCLVNQSTDLITEIKTIDIFSFYKIFITIILIVFFTFLIYIFIKTKYFDEIVDFFKNI